ncbi:MAG: pilus assembly protein TadG-related protein [Gaiellaceae bacterium]
MSRTGNERGQVIVLTVIALTVLLGMSALVLDVGAWFRSKRQLQATADAAALAGAQALPDTPGAAFNMALDYANKNGGAVAGGDVTITSTNVGNDTISVAAKKQEPGFFSTVLGVSVVDVGAKATAIVGTPNKARYVAPMVVSCNHDLIKNCNDSQKLPTFNVPTQLDFDKMGAPGAFGMLDLANSKGNTGSKELGDWIQYGYNSYLPLGKYDSDPGAKFNSSNVSGALQNRVGSVLLFPVFDTLTGNGSNAQYNIIGWVGFHLTQVGNIQGNNATLYGYFTEYIAQGILPSSGGQGSSNFGVKSIQLIK